ncbi:unnamed protein product [Agarophyton chilense]
MSSSIPIPSRAAASCSPSLSSPPPSALLGKSLPSRHSLYAPPSPAPTLPLRSSQDDLATIVWPPRPPPSFQLVSRAARKWQHARHPPLSAAPTTSKRSSRFDPWDFSEVAAATAEVKTAFQRGSARAERPPREGVSGTYFIRRNESKGAVLCVFKPIDEEAIDIEMSPTMPKAHSTGSPAVPSDLDFSLGPAFGVTSPKPPSPGVGQTFTRTTSLSSDSEFDSRFSRASGFYPGEGAYKEVAAYLLDHERFARVPQTALAMWSDIPHKDEFDDRSPRHSFSSDGADSLPYADHFLTEGNSTATEQHQDGSHLRTKMGAFQVYVENVGDADDYGPGVFDRDQVHRIAVLDDYIVKYAGRRIHDVVSRIAARKEEEKSHRQRKSGRGLTRARSIPEFGALGIGARPLHTLLRQGSVPGVVPTNSPVSSPRQVPAEGAYHHHTHSLGSALPRYSQTAIRAPPIQIPINDGRIERISIPEPVGSGAFHDGLGRTEDEEDDDRLAREVGNVRLGSLASLFKEERKSSPVAPLDMMLWESESS